MLRSRVSQARLGRVTTRPILQAPARALYSTSRSSSFSKLKKVTKYTLVVGMLGAPGLWWLEMTPTRNGDGIFASRLKDSPTEDLTLEHRSSKEDVTRILTQNAYHVPVKNVAGVDRYDGTQVASHNPCEDRFIHGRFPSPWGDDSQWMVWGIFDGHFGWQTADLLEKQLLPIVRQSLINAQPTSEKETVDSLVQRTIIQAFMGLDYSMMGAACAILDSEEPLQDKIKTMIPACAGSCALLTLYDPVTTLLHVASTGNSTALLAQKVSDGKWDMMPLSKDHAAYNKAEVDRIKQQHPGEEDVIQHERFLGLPVTRAFGDARWKFPLAVQKELTRRFGALGPLKQNIQTPPYLTAAPDVASVNIDPSKQSFLIMASAGFWEFITWRQAIDLVGKWIESQGTKAQYDPEPTYEPFDFGEHDTEAIQHFDKKRTTVQDDNAAVHLVRNALGGNHHEMLAGRLAMTAPFAYAVRDDITVQVVFFNQSALGSKGK
ncbi:putative pyruvate dehydrogenase [Annulohypoxylon moriforme]|nr:putative pyruvate dehydrogenase [Annulohypoxylon moriforme]